MRKKLHLKWLLGLIAVAKFVLLKRRMGEDLSVIVNEVTTGQIRDNLRDAKRQTIPVMQLAKDFTHCKE